MVSKNNLKTDEAADREMEEYFKRLVSEHRPNFANAREARNYFDRVKLNQGRRLRQLMSLSGFDRQELYWLRAEDMIVNDL